MKDRVERSYLTRFDAFSVNRDQVMDLETWFKIHTNISNVEIASPKTIYKLLKFFTSFVTTEKSRHSTTILKKLRSKSRMFADFKSITEIIKIFKSLYVWGRLSQH